MMWIVVMYRLWGVACSWDAFVDDRGERLSRGEALQLRGCSSMVGAEIAGESLPIGDTGERWGGVSFEAVSHGCCSAGLLDVALLGEFGTPQLLRTRVARRLNLLVKPGPPTQALNSWGCGRVL